MKGDEVSEGGFIRLMVLELFTVSNDMRKTKSRWKNAKT